MKCHKMLMDLSRFRQNFVKIRTRLIFCHGLKEHPIYLVKLQRLVAKYCQIRKTPKDFNIGDEFFSTVPD